MSLQRKENYYYKTMRAAASILDDNKPNYIPRVTNKRNTLLHSELNPENFFFVFQNLVGKYFWLKLEFSSWSESFSASHATYVNSRRLLEFAVTEPFIKLEFLTRPPLSNAIALIASRVQILTKVSDESQWQCSLSRISVTQKSFLGKAKNGINTHLTR